MPKVLAAGIGVLLALACSSCGGAKPPVTHAANSAPQKGTKPQPLVLPPAANLVILSPVSGAGNTRFGTFTASGTVYFEVSCKGRGPITIAGIVRHFSPCDGSPTSASVPYKSGEPVHLAVQAPTGTTWKLAVGEHVPGSALVLAHRTGAGKASLGTRCRHVRPLNLSPNPCQASLGTFRLHGILHVAASCKGHGQLVVSVDFLSKRNGIAVRDDYCPMTETVQTFPATDGKVRVAVTRAPTGTWHVTLRETPAK